MSDYQQESLSALLDGEADELELHRLLKALEQDSELTRRWERFHLVQSVMHNRGVPVSETLAARVAHALEQEELTQAEPVKEKKEKPAFGFFRQISKIAVAACVALVAVIALQPATTPETPETSPAIAQQPAQVPAMRSTASVTPASLVAELPVAHVDPEAQRRLREYIESMRFDEEEPVRIEHIQDSPWYHLVNDLQNTPR